MNDLISRAAAIEAIEKHIRTAEEPYQLTDVDKVMNHAFEIAASCVYNLPSAQPEQRWIPCSERLPKKPNVYTVTDSNDRVVRFVFTGTDSSREYWKKCAKAWKPLPEPYREDDHEID